MIITVVRVMCVHHHLALDTAYANSKVTLEK